MAGRAFAMRLQRLRRTLPGALIWRGLSYAPDYSGRARRRDFFLVLLVSVAAFALLSPLAVLDRTPFALFDLLGLTVLCGLPIVAAMVRRLHDINRHASAMFIAFFPYIGWAILGFFMIIEGAEQDNIFGPNPRA